MTTPAWSGAQNGATGNLNTTNQAGQINQFLGAHNAASIYDGTAIITPNGGTQFTWVTYGNGYDIDQPFTMSGTSIGRVTIPVLPVGNGADMLVSLYPDNGSGAPNTAGGAIAATTVPAAVINNVAAPNGIANGGPLATERFNTMYGTGTGASGSPWAYPAGDVSGTVDINTVITSGNYMILLGGQGRTTLNPVGVVFTLQYGGNGILELPQPQPALPQPAWNVMATTTTAAIVATGGAINDTTNTTDTWVASWDQNTGTIGSWSLQTALPAALDLGAVAASGDTVYVIGGRLIAGSTLVNTVYRATVTNGQLSSWQTDVALPVAIYNSFATVLNGWLIVAGGLTALGTTVPTSTVYYSKINADGTLSPWQVGPSMPTACIPRAVGWSTAVTDSQLVIVGGQSSSIADTAAIQVLSVTANGLADTWYSSNYVFPGEWVASAFPVGNGQWQVITAYWFQPDYYYTTLTPVPEIPVPLYATGLTNGSVYHIVVQQRQLTSSSDYLAWGVNSSALPIAANNSQRHSGTWTPIAGFSMPVTVYSASSSPNGLVRHLWQDPNGYGVAQGTSTLLYNNLNLLTGCIETVAQPNNPLNTNPTFASGTSPWTATGGTVTQSNAQVHGGFAFSGLLTPDGVSAQAVALSELFPVLQGDGPFYGASQWLLLDGWFYSPPGTTAFSFSINWFDRLGTLLSTSSSTVTLAAATWTHVQNYFEVPATAAQGQLAPTESGTPANTKLIYCSNVFAIKSWECVGAFTSAATVNYGASPWPPTGITQLN